jgi:UDP-N-acetyl-D-mannosaminuronic acid dehydrogenase
MKEVSQTGDAERLCVLGTGYVGLTLAVTLAEAGFDVVGVDVLPEVVARLQRGESHFYEPGLDDLLRRHAGRRLRFSTDIPGKSCNYYFIAVGTPVDPQSHKPILTHLRHAAESLLPHLKRGDTVVLRSTVPVGVSRHLAVGVLERGTGLTAGRDFSFGFVPERTVEGNALHEQKHLPQILGPIDTASAERIRAIFQRFNERIVVLPDMEHAELCKIIDNTYRDVTFAYANQLAMISEGLGLDFHRIRQACNWDYPRNNIPLPSPGVGGACLTKDPYILIDLCQKQGIDTTLIQAARFVNQQTVFALARRILNRLSGAGKSPAACKIFLMGFAFKGNPETSDVRFSTTFDLVEHLRPFCARLYGYDGVASTEQIREAGVVPTTIEGGFDQADAVVIMNSHRTHKDLDLDRLIPRASAPLLFVDCWNLYGKDRFAGNPNVHYCSIGLY